MTEQTEMDLFDSAISSEQTAEPATPVTPEVTTQEQPRDGNGRFTSEAPTTPQEPTTETPAQPTTEAPAPVPVAAVQDERRKRQEAERRAEELERRLAALESKSAAPSQATQTQATQEAPDFWSDPQAYLSNQLTPYQQEIAQVRELIMKDQAERRHGAEKLGAAEAAMNALTDEGAKRALASEVFAGGNPFDNLVKWHERQETLKVVGNDPQAWLQAELDKKMQDPAFLAQAMERARGQATVHGGQTANAPLTKLPPSLSRIPASGNANATAEPQTDAELFNSVTSRR